MYLTLKRSVAPRRGLRWWAVLPILLVAWARLQAATQTLSWISPAEDRPLIWGRAYPLMAQTSSGLPVTFRVLSGPAFTVDGAVTATNAGTITLVAEQAGSLQFDPVSLTRSLNQTTLSSMRRGGYETSGSACAVQVLGNLTDVAADTAGLQLIEVSDPAKPVRIGGYDSLGLARGCGWMVDAPMWPTRSARSSGGMLRSQSTLKPIRLGSHLCGGIYLIG